MKLKCPECNTEEEHVSKAKHVKTYSVDYEVTCNNCNHVFSSRVWH